MVAIETVTRDISSVTFYETVETVGKAIDIVGVTVIAGGAVIAAAATVARLRRRSGTDSYRTFRQQLGRCILLGLEFLVAADIIRTVAISPTGESIAVLAGIVAIRTFLSFTLELEITGYWPWQKPAAPSSTAPPETP